MSKIEHLRQAFSSLQPEHLELLDESHMHSRGLETHYKAVIVSAQFDGLNAVKRHQRAYAALGEWMGQVHAMSLHTYTPQEWQQQGVVPASPTCLGGSKHDH